jgi:hypothetical protein
MERDSAFPVKFESFDGVWIDFGDEQGEHRLEDSCVTVSYSSDTTHVFTPTDIDWVNGANNSETSVTWRNQALDSTTLVKVALHDLNQSSLVSTKTDVDNPNFVHPHTEYVLDEEGNETTKAVSTYGIPSNAKVIVKFTAKIPSYIQNTGESNVAWNTFAYYYDTENYTNMVAEPSKVGVWVSDKSYGGAILVRKKFKTNLPDNPQHFYFAIYDGRADLGGIRKSKESVYMAGSKTGTQADVTFTNLELKSGYYIYETDSNYNLLIGTIDTNESGEEVKKITGVIQVDADGNLLTEVDSAGNTVFKTASYNDFEFEMNNTAQQTQKDNQVLENSEYFVWNKDLSKTKTYNSAIFTNEYFVDAEVNIMGPFYADVPTDKEVTNISGMISTRPTSFTEGQISTDNATKSNERESAGYNSAIDGYGNDVHQHTIATGFLAKIKGVGTYTVEEAKWTISSTTGDTNINKQLRATDDPGVYVRLKTTAKTNSADETASYDSVYLDELAFWIDDAADTIAYNADEDDVNGDVLDTSDEITFGGADDEAVFDGDTELVNYDYTERNRMIAQMLELSEDDILYDENGRAYVLMYTGNAASLSDDSSSEDKTNATSGTDNDSSGFTDKDDAEFGDAGATSGYQIYKLPKDNNKTYTWQINDPLPHVTLSENSEVYIGIIIDQLYDRNAYAKLELTDKASYDTTIADAANIANNGKDGKGDLQYTHVSSPSVTEAGKVVFNSKSVLYKVESGIYKFDGDSWGYSDSTSVVSNMLNKAGTVKIKATSSKNLNFKKSNVTILGDKKYSGYLQLNGTGCSDYRSVVINVKPGQTISVIALSSGGSARTLNAVDRDGNLLGTLTAPGKSATEISGNTFKVPSDYSGPVYIYSAGSGINIYEISVN